MKKILIISALLSALTLTGCKDFLVQEPITSQSTEQLLSTYNGLNNATMGAYSPMVSNYWYGGLYFLLDADTRAGIAAWPVQSSFQSGRMQTGFTLNYNENSTNGPWTYAYYVISAANNVLEQLELNGENLVSSLVTQQDLDNIKAECLTLRALAHFDLYRITSQEDLETAGLYDYLDEGAVVAAEWSENFAGLLALEHPVTVDIRRLEGDERAITIEGVEL